MANNTISIISGGTLKKLTSNHLKQPANYLVETENNIFFYEHKIISNEPSEKLLKKIIPFIENEFF